MVIFLSCCFFIINDFSPPFLHLPFPFPIRRETPFFKTESRASIRTCASVLLIMPLSAFFRMRKRSSRNRWKLPRLFLVLRDVPQIGLLISHLPPLCTLYPRTRRRFQPLPVPLPDLLTHKDGAKGRDGSHDECDAGFEALPEHLPDGSDAAEVGSS